MWHVDGMVAHMRTPTNWSSPLAVPHGGNEVNSRYIEVGSPYVMARWGGQRLAPHWVQVPPPPPPSSGSAAAVPPTVVVTAPPHPRYIAGTLRLVHMLRAVLKSRAPIEIWACDAREAFPAAEQRRAQR